ncbi:MAG: hypothetical protein B6A08_20140 [Sorangiineae bacterium NIC37A_2]|nr:MAG: hypothetical protein B6A08_20140 [Sorangiineae bacterium NIC37A_2]
MILLTVALGFVACGSDQIEDKDGMGGEGGSGGGQLPDSLTRSIGPDGGTLRIRGITVTVPKNALPKPTALTISNLGDKAISELPTIAPGLTRVSRPAAFEPHGQTFAVPIEIEMVANTNAKSASVYRLDDPEDQTWEQIALVTNNLPDVKFGTTKFSIYSVFTGEPTEPPMGSGGGEPGSGGTVSVGGSESGAGGSPSASGGAEATGGLGGEPSPGAGGSDAGPEIRPYYDDGTWYGYWFSTAPSTQAIATNLAEGDEPFCITSGSLGARERAGFGFALAETMLGDRESYGPGANEGFSFLMENVAQAELPFEVSLIDADGNVYCVQRTMSERVLSGTAPFFFDEFQVCSGNPSRLPTFVSLQVEVVGEVPDARFCIGSFDHIAR